MSEGYLNRREYLLNKIQNKLEYTTIDELSNIQNILFYIIQELAEEFKYDNEMNNVIKDLQIEVKNLKSGLDELYNNTQKRIAC